MTQQLKKSFQASVKSYAATGSVKRASDFGSTMDKSQKLMKEATQLESQF